MKRWYSIYSWCHLLIVHVAEDGLFPCYSSLLIWVSQLLFIIIVRASSFQIHVEFGCRVDDLLQSSDSDEEGDDEEDKPAAKKMKRAQRNEARKGTWLKEDEDIVDFLDPSVVKKVFGWSLSVHFARSSYCH